MLCDIFFQNLVGLASCTTVERTHASDKATPGLMLQAFNKAEELYGHSDVIVAAHDEARSLRMIVPFKHPSTEDIILLGAAWPADIQEWPTIEELRIPRRDISKGSYDVLFHSKLSKYLAFFLPKDSS